jgi:hypothetical protein
VAPLTAPVPCAFLPSSLISEFRISRTTAMPLQFQAAAAVICHCCKQAGSTAYHRMQGAAAAAAAGK